MPKSRMTEEARIIQWFQQASLDQVNIVFGIVKGIVAAKNPRLPKAKAKSKQRPAPRPSEVESAGA